MELSTLDTSLHAQQYLADDCIDITTTAQNSNLELGDLKYTEDEDVFLKSSAPL